MISVTRDERSFIVASDDAHAENAALQDAVEASAPHLAGDFAATQVDNDGLLRWRVQREDWGSLLEILETLGVGDDIDPDEVGAAIEEVEAATKEEV